MHPHVMRLLAIERHQYLLERVERVPRGRDGVRPRRVDSAPARSPIAHRVSAALRQVGLLNITSRARADS